MTHENGQAGSRIGKQTRAMREADVAKQEDNKVRSGCVQPSRMDGSPHACMQACCFQANFERMHPQACCLHTTLKLFVGISYLDMFLVVSSILVVPGIVNCVARVQHLLMNYL